VKKLIIGILCILLAAGLLVYVYLSIRANTAQEGVMKGNIKTYKPPYENHGLLMVVLLGVGMLLFEKPHLPDIRSAGVSILYAGILSCGVAYTLQILGQRETPPTLATLLMSLESVFAALSGWLILHERLTLREGAGCILVFTAVTAAQLLTAAEQSKNERKEQV